MWMGEVCHTLDHYILRIWWGSILGNFVHHQLLHFFLDEILVNSFLIPIWWHVFIEDFGFKLCTIVVKYGYTSTFVG